MPESPPRAVLRLARPPTLTVDLLGWSADGLELRFMVGGDQTAGPHAGAKGFWIASVAGSGGPVATLAFVPVGEGPFGPCAWAPDGSALAYVAAQERCVWDRETGESGKLASVGANAWRLEWPAFSLLLAGILALEVSRNGGWQARAGTVGSLRRGLGLRRAVA